MGSDTNPNRSRFKGSKVQGQNRTEPPIERLNLELLNSCYFVSPRGFAMTLQSWKTWVALAALIAIVGGFGVWWWRTSGYVSTDDARIKAEVVAVSAELTAKLNSLTKEEGELVTRQEVLATLDRRELEILLQQADAEADRLRNKAQQGAREIELHITRQKEEVIKAEAALRASRHQFDDARAHADQAKEDWSRNQKLFDRALVAEQELERAKTSLRQADAQLSTMQEKIKEGAVEPGFGAHQGPRNGGHGGRSSGPQRRRAAGRSRARRLAPQAATDDDSQSGRGSGSEEKR